MGSKIHNMEYLKELVKMTSRNKHDVIAIYSDQSEQLFELIKNGKAETDKEAINQIFGSDRHGAKYYSRIKGRLNERLLNTYLCASTEKTDIQKVFSKCHRDYATFQKLAAAGLWTQARRLGDRLLKQSIKHHFTVITYATARKLKRHYSTIIGQRKKYLACSDIVKKYRRILHLEEIAEDYYCEIASNFVRTKNPRRNLLPIIEEYVSELRELQAETDSYWFNLFYYNIAIIEQELKRDYEQVITISQEATAFFKNLGFQPPYIGEFTFLCKSAPAYLQLERYEEGKAVIEKGLEMAPKGSYNWIVMLKYNIKLAFHQKDYLTAYNCIQEGYKYVEGLQKEQFKIREAWCHLFAELGLLDIEEKKFRIHKLLNELVVYSQDKKGNNISIQFLQVLFYLVRGEYGKVIDRLETLKIYARRYLGKGTPRSKYFLELILLFADCNFEVELFQEKSKALRTKLSNTPMSTQDGNIETVPYEDLLDVVLGRVLV